MAIEKSLACMDMRKENLSQSFIRDIPPPILTFLVTPNIKFDHQFTVSIAITASSTRIFAFSHRRCISFSKNDEAYPQMVQNMPVLNSSEKLGGIWFAEWNSMELGFIKEFDLKELE